MPATESRVNPVGSKDIINNFFEGKRSEIQKNQLGFKSVLAAMPPQPSKYPVRASQMRPPRSREASKSPISRNDEEEERLKMEVNDLKRKLEAKET